MQVTIAICTWNREDVLKETLLNLCSLITPSEVALHLLVINNNCTDDTDAVVASFTDRLPISILHEQKAGLSHARNCAIESSNSDILIFIDDDIFVAPNWLVEYVDAFTAYQDADFFGGSLDLAFETNPPKWLKSSLSELGDTFGKRDLGVAARTFTDEEYPLGGNMAFRRRVLEDNRFDPLIGRTAGGLLGGEEVAFVDTLRNAGSYGIAVGQARGQHFVPEDRINSKFIWDWHYGCGKTLAITMSDNEEDCTMLFGKPRWAIYLYLKSKLIAMCLAPTRNKCWLRNFTTAAKARGIIDGYQSQ